MATLVTELAPGPIIVATVRTSDLEFMPTFVTEFGTLSVLRLALRAFHFLSGPGVIGENERGVEIAYKLPAEKKDPLGAK